MTEAKIFIHQIHDPEKSLLENMYLLLKMPIVREIRVNEEELSELRVRFEEMCEIIDDQTGTRHLIMDSDQRELFLLLKAAGSRVI